MRKIFTLPLFVIVPLLFFAQAPTGEDSKTKQLEEMRKLKQQMIEEQKTIQQQQEWNNQSSQQEIKKLNAENQAKSMEIQVSRQEVQKVTQDYAKAKQLLEAKQLELANTDKRIDSAKALLRSTQSQLQQSEMVVKRTQEELQHREDSIKFLQQEQVLQELKMQKQESELTAQKQKNQLYIIAAVLGIGLFIVVAVLLAYRQKTISALAEKNKIIEEEKRRSDELLLNILPEEVMNELKIHGKTTPQNYAKATVLFADIKDFTTISEQLSPEALIEGLDAYFERFDKVIEKFDIEKIKTIGDAYVCAGGVPTKSEVNPHQVVQAAVEFVHEIDKLRKQRLSEGKIPFEFRIGIHTGQLVAGVIGIRKFAYDIWGDTVNMAARMEEASEAGKINISGATYELVKDKFACVYRGKIPAKHKGEIDMYFVQTNILT